MTGSLQVGDSTDSMGETVDLLARWTMLTNHVAFEINVVRNTCITTSMALANVLRRNGFEADVFRAEIHVHCLEHERCSGSFAGGDGDGTRRKASPGGWLGHLAVECGDYILDPTADQLSTGCGLTPRPLVALKPPGWDAPPPGRPWQGGEWLRLEEGGMAIRHGRYKRQVGWKSASAARQSYWKPLADLIIKYGAMP